MPIVTITFADSLDVKTLEALRDLLPDVVAECVDCPEEPWFGPPQLGDIDLQFRQRHELDVGGLPCVIEIHSKLLPGLVETKNERVDRATDRIAPVMEDQPFGVWLKLHEGAWSQRPDV